MALESATYISGLNSSNPASGDAVSFGDDHIRLCKSTILASFPSVDQAVQCIHVKATAPTTNVAAGLLWFDSASNVLKLRNEANSAWVTLPLSPETSYKIMGSTTVGWTLPTADGTSGQLLKTNGAGALDWATDSDVGRIIATTVTEQSSATISRSESYVDTGWSITHNKTSTTSDLHVSIHCAHHMYSSWGDLGCSNMYAYARLANSSGTLITGQTDNIQIADMRDQVPSGCSTVELQNSWSYLWKVTAAQCPDGTSGNNEFKIYSKVNDADDGGSSFSHGVMTVYEVKV
tara:strand:- start:306 stop:1178 length:873 start_codon:yes stop_codon:yes gene_type:complete